MFLLPVVVVAVVAGFLLGGRLGRLADVRLRSPWLFYLAIAMQMLATGGVSTLDEARRIIEHSFPAERFVPAAGDRWNAHYRRFRDYVELTCV